MAKSETKKPGFFKRIGNYFRELKSEIKKVVWPSKRDTFRNTLVVLISIVIVGVFVALLDLGFSALLGLLY